MSLTTININIIGFVIAGLFVASSFVAIGLVFYIGRTRIKEIDKIVYGYEYPHDSIFALLIRVPIYAGAFVWRWSAKRAGLVGKIERFDNNFRWPFVACFFLFLFSILCLVVGILFDKYFIGT